MEVWRTVVLTGALLVLGGVAACATPAPGPGGDDPLPTPAPPTAAPSDPSEPASPSPVPTVPVPSGPTTTPVPVPDDLAAGATWLQVVLDETGTGPEVSWTVSCDPASGEVLGGDHPSAAEACALLAEDGDARAAFTPTPATVACTEQWGGPQVAVVRGVLAGQDVGEVRFDRANGCEISRWDALAPLLGSTGGATM